jgi:hypothetical protein
VPVVLGVGRILRAPLLAVLRGFRREDTGVQLEKLVLTWLDRPGGTGEPVAV